MSAIIHNFYILESDKANNYYVYSGPSAKENVNKKFNNINDATAFLVSLK